MFEYGDQDIDYTHLDLLKKEEWTRYGALQMYQMFRPVLLFESNEQRRLVKEAEHNIEDILFQVEKLVWILIIVYHLINYLILTL